MGNGHGQLATVLQLWLFVPKGFFNIADYFIISDPLRGKNDTIWPRVLQTNCCKNFIRFFSKILLKPCYISCFYKYKTGSGSAIRIESTTSPSFFQLKFFFFYFENFGRACRPLRASRKQYPSEYLVAAAPQSRARLGEVRTRTFFRPSGLPAIRLTGHQANRPSG